ncbi:DNA alkylation repair protein [Candidatus Finniella inopinata]|uniref:DNA alkylation repair protein n=1 Tax=Candidatus Finniella inopinata TaxID=1696036 RepID=A0A4Q7DJM0_9PROT|nr:DNA alkylation repair protein [Candidatus Finniella inopinata]RZI46942.1 DNA alkylation repair protein [Candidatus Finniella inopinata]
MNKASHIKTLLANLAKQSPPPKVIFFKTGPGAYSEHDEFMGLSVPALRKIARHFPDLPLMELQILLESPFNEERMQALIILVAQYQRSDTTKKQALYNFYVRHITRVNNWNLVDASAHHIMGHYLYDKPRYVLLAFAQSNNLWERRIAIVATWHFIRQGHYDWTLKIAEILLDDAHDLIHKSVGWMLREVGKKDGATLKAFLDQKAPHMPRTMLRYAIERLPIDERKSYLEQSRAIRTFDLHKIDG